MNKVCIFGASGLLGRAITERLLQRHDLEVNAIIHSEGNAWPLLRFNIPLLKADLANLEEIDNVLNGCTHVVNCSLGSNDTMIGNLSNLILSCKRNKIKRLIHISSITVYGEEPHTRSEKESGPVLAKRRSYGWYKNRQDRLVEKAQKEGLSSVVLCPPHITGAYGRIFHQVLGAIKSGTFLLVDDGQYPCNLVDINNLCRAIELALFVEESDGKRIFVTNGDEFTWADFVRMIAPLAGKKFQDIPHIPADQVKLVCKNKNLPLSRFLKLTMKIPEVKNLARQTVLKKNEVLYKLIKLGYALFKIPNISNPIGDNNKVKAIVKIPEDDAWLISQQLRGIRHRTDRAKDCLGYIPAVNSSESITLFRNYYSELFGYEDPYWDLSKML